jgi:hypothetical protein
MKLTQDDDQVKKKNYKEFLKINRHFMVKSARIHMWRPNEPYKHIVNEYTEKCIDIIDGDDAVQRLQVSRKTTYQ